MFVYPCMPFSYMSRCVIHTVCPYMHVHPTGETVAVVYVYCILCTLFALGVADEILAPSVTG